MEVDNDAQKLVKIKSSEINNALGLFIVFFGVVIIIATFFTSSFIGQMTNLVAGIVLSTIGAVMVLKAKLTIKKINNTK
ncbi:MAG: hypothetical protein ABFS12_07075 [Bacteroidota bacterium]